MYGRDLVKTEMGFIVGDGTYINTWTYLWISDHPPRPPRARVPDINGQKVNYFFAENG